MSVLWDISPLPVLTGQKPGPAPSWSASAGPVPLRLYRILSISAPGPGSDVGAGPDDNAISAGSQAVPTPLFPCCRSSRWDTTSAVPSA